MSMMTLQGAFTSGELSPSLSARVDLAKYQQGCRTLRNFLVQPHGGAVKRPGFLLIDALPMVYSTAEDNGAVLLPFVFNADQSYCLVFGHFWLRIATREGMVLGDDGTPYEIASPYSLAQARQISSTQSADVLFLACQEVAPHKLKRLAHNQWEFEKISFTVPLTPPTGVTGEGVNGATKSDGSAQPAQLVTPYEYVVTAVDENGKESEASAGWKFTGPASNCWYSGYYVKVSWAKVTDATAYRVYKKEFGGRPGFLAETGDTVYQDYNTRPVLSDGPPKWVDPFKDGDYPATVCFFEQRLVFASSPKRPQTVWMSKNGDYTNFSTSTPLKADDSLELTIASNEVSAMRWMVALRSLILGTSSMEGEMASGEGAFTAKTAKFTPQSYRGSAALRALVVGNIILHVARSGREVRDLQYDFGADSYAGTDRTILATHLFEGRRITGWAYQPSPDGIVWVVRDDGILLGMTFQPEHEVFAWHRHDTQGQFRSVCSVATGQDDTLFVVVERFGAYFLESMAPRFGENVANGVFLDSALQYRGDATATVSGLEHLEGQTVGIVADGAVHPLRKVQGGRVTLDAPASVITAGLTYTADLETMPVEIATQEGASVGRKKYINAVNILFRDTVTAKAGCSFDRLETIKWRTTEALGQGLAPSSGAYRVVVPELARNTATVCIRSDAPLPMTVLAIMPEVEVK